MNNRKSIFVVIIAVVAIIMIERYFRPDPKVRNVEIMTEMVYSPGYKAFEPNPNFADGRTMRQPVAGTIPRGYLPLYDRATMRLEDAGSLKNPFKADVVVLARGRVVYQIFCQVCHGPAGLGDGPVTKRGVPPPPSFLGESTAQLSDGQIYYILSEGKANMPSYAAQIGRDDRWKVIHYMKTLRNRAGTTP